MQPSQFIWIGGSGCLLPFLIIFNLFFGKLIFSSTRLWLGIEAILILLFILKINLIARKVDQQGRGFASASKSHGQSYKPQDKVIDIEGEVVEEKKKLK